MKINTILLIDDEPLNLTVLKNLLVSKNYHVIVASNPHEGIRLAHSELPDCILLDIYMPEMNGLEACGIIKANESTKHIPVLFITAKDDTDLLLKGFKVGAVDYITKPFNEEEVLVRLKTHIDLKNVRDELSANNQELKENAIQLRSMHEATLKQTKANAQKSEMLYNAFTEIEKKNEKINASINYGYRIQNAIMPDERELEGYTKDYFVFFKPKDIVSGDIFWIKEYLGNLYIAAIDCTGHGVPGAFLSILANSLLTGIVTSTQDDQPGGIIKLLNESVVQSMQQNGSSSGDGMDLSLIKYDIRNKTLQFAGAHNPLFIVSQSGEVNLIKGDRFGVGGNFKNIKKQFITHDVELKKGDWVYIYSDGFQDQIGGEANRKYMSKRFRSFLQSISMLSGAEQKALLKKELDEWKGRAKTIDDVLIIGIQF
ncbi:MAG: response regulator [Cyclobacteriaceae bacterium]|nr:response regulator [Cyclobacteriaceae bacterium]MCH8517073.1 response regulator [Cyclobacteriaceae bacterium]